MAYARAPSAGSRVPCSSPRHFCWHSDINYFLRRIGGNRWPHLNRAVFLVPIWISHLSAWGVGKPSSQLNCARSNGQPAHRHRSVRPAGVTSSGSTLRLIPTPTQNPCRQMWPPVAARLPTTDRMRTLVQAPRTRVSRGSILQAHHATDTPSFRLQLDARHRKRTSRRSS